MSCAASAGPSSFVLSEWARSRPFPSRSVGREPRSSTTGPPDTGTISVPATAPSGPGASIDTSTGPVRGESCARERQGARTQDSISAPPDKDDIIFRL